MAIVDNDFIESHLLDIFDEVLAYERSHRAIHSAPDEEDEATGLII